MFANLCDYLLILLTNQSRPQNPRYPCPAERETRDNYKPHKERINKYIYTHTHFQSCGVVTKQQDSPTLINLSFYHNNRPCQVSEMARYLFTFKRIFQNLLFIVNIVNIV